MSLQLNIDNALCIQCGKCVQVCPADILAQNENQEVCVASTDFCIQCGHCVCACPRSAVMHSAFPADRVHKIDYTQLPTPEQMMLLCKVRRSNRAFTKEPIARDKIELILEAAHRAPTGSNVQHVNFVVINDSEKLKEITEFTLDVFGGMVKKLKNPLLKPLIKLIMPDALRYVPVFERIISEYANGDDGILRKATSVIFLYTPKGTRMGVLDANLAYQNGSLMAETLGVSQFYTGFVINAAKAKKGKLERLLGVEGEIHAGMALGMPAFRFPYYVDRNEIEVF